MIDGVVSYLGAWLSSEVSMSGGSAGQVLAWNDSRLTIAGGSANTVLAYNGAVVTMSGGSVAGDVVASESSTFAMTGGSIAGSVAAYLAPARVTISGGTLGGSLYPNEGGSITIVGRDFSVDPAPVGSGGTVPAGEGPLHYSTGRLFGTLASGDPIDSLFSNGAMITLAPEADRSMLSLGVLASLALLTALHRARPGREL